MTNYEQIAGEHREYYGKGRSHLRIYKQLYNDKTHFVYELVQNADDNKSLCLELQLGKDGLLVWNDGDQFSEEDVRSICSIGLSNKDLTQIGTFGIGFKAVYNYTDLPEIYSSDECFCIRNLIEPKGIDGIPPESYRARKSRENSLSPAFQRSPRSERHCIPEKAAWQFRTISIIPASSENGSMA